MGSLVWRYDATELRHKRRRFKFKVRQAINNLNNIASEVAVEVWRDLEFYGRNLFFFYKEKNGHTYKTVRHCEMLHIFEWMLF